MKVTWEVSDIRGGLVVHLNSSKELFVITWQTEYNGNKYFLCSLSDGMLLQMGRKESATKYLNDMGYRLFNQIRFNATVSSMLQKSDS